MAMLLGRRRRILMDNLQYRLLAVNLVYFFTILMIFAATLFLPLIIQLKSDILSVSQRHEIASQFLSLHTRLWPAILAVFVLLAIHSIFFSHRIAGPLYRFRMIFKAVTEGDLSVRAIIRTNDFLHREADIINDMIESLNTRIKGFEEQSGELSEVLAELKKAIDNGSVGEINQNIESLQDQLDRLRLSVHQFNTGAEEGQMNDDGAGNIVSPSSSEASATITRA